VIGRGRVPPGGRFLDDGEGAATAVLQAGQTPSEAFPRSVVTKIARLTSLTGLRPQTSSGRRKSSRNEHSHQSAVVNDRKVVRNRQPYSTAAPADRRDAKCESR